MNDYDQRRQRQERAAQRRYDRLLLSPPERDPYDECPATCKLRGYCPGASAEDCEEQRLWAYEPDGDEPPNAETEKPAMKTPTRDTCRLDGDDPCAGCPHADEDGDCGMDQPTTTTTTDLDECSHCNGYGSSLQGPEASIRAPSVAEQAPKTECPGGRPRSPNGTPQPNGGPMERYTHEELLGICQMLLDAECWSCPGWLLNEGDLEVQRCDDCGRFEDDHQAAQYVYELLSLRGWLTHKLPPGTCHCEACRPCFVSVLLNETPS